MSMLQGKSIPNTFTMQNTQKVKNLRVSSLWGIMWFWLGVRVAIALVLSGNLYFASIITTAINVGLSALIILLILRKSNALKSRLFFWTFVFYLVTIISTLFSPAVNSSNFLRVAGLLSSSFAIFVASLLCIGHLQPLMALRIMLRGLITGTLLSSGLLVALDPSILVMQYAGRFGDYELLHPNILAVFYATCFLGLTFLNLYPLLVRYALAILFGGLLLVTISKTSIIAVLIAILTGWLIQRGYSKIKSTLFYAIIFFPLVVFGGDLLVNRFQIYLNTPQALTLSGRIPLWEYLLYILKVRPLVGYGFGVLRDVIPASLLGWNIVYINNAHNALLDILFSSGYFGLGIFLVLVMYVFRMLVWDIFYYHNLPILIPVLFVFLIVQSITNASLNLGFDFFIFVTIGLISEKVVNTKKSKRH